MPPAPRGGRGGRAGLNRGRPPPAVRNAMAELGKGSLQAYELLAQAAARSNVDAARGYFPDLDPSKKAHPKPLLPSERHIVKLWLEIQHAIQASPHYLQPNPHRNNAASNGWADDLFSLRQYYFMGGASPSAAATAAQQSGSDGNQDKPQAEGDTQPPKQTAARRESLWDDSKGWYISELLPAELLPKKVRYVKKEFGQVIHGRKRKKPRLSNGLSRFNVNEEDNDDDNNDVNNDDDAAPDNAHPANDDEDDLELDADYQTGITFDDDEGYEENDSGAEEATF